MVKDNIYDSPGPTNKNFDFLDELSDVKDELESENGEGLNTHQNFQVNDFSFKK